MAGLPVLEKENITITHPVTPPVSLEYLGLPWQESRTRLANRRLDEADTAIS